MSRPLFYLVISLIYQTKPKWIAFVQCKSHQGKIRISLSLNILI